MHKPSQSIQDEDSIAAEEFAAFAPPVGAVPLPRLPPADAIARWETLKQQLASLLREAQPDAAWVARLQRMAEELIALAHRDIDTALYLLVQTAGQDVNQYSAHHAMLCAIVCELCAQRFGWTADERASGIRAALTMNLSMAATQDTLARQISAPTAAQRRQVADHAQDSALLLEAAGVKDATWLETVRRHHEEPRGDEPADGGSPGQRLAQLLHRVDVYTAKLSTRSSRQASSPAIAARDACLDRVGVPDAIGGTILRVLGLYPPGTYVQLASGEIAVVIERGAKAHTPVVASLRRADGGLLLHPVRRDTTQAEHAVVRGVAASEVKVRMNQWRVLAA